MEEKTINKTVRMNEIRKEIAWISSEYSKMFPTDPRDLTLIADNDRLHCMVLFNLLSSLKEEITENKYEASIIDKLIIVKLETKFIILEDLNFHKIDQGEEARLQKLLYTKMD